MFQPQLQAIAASLSGILVKGAAVDLVGGDFVLHVHPEQCRLIKEPFTECATGTHFPVECGLGLQVRIEATAS